MSEPVPSEPVRPDQRIALVDLLDRVLAGGVVISGDIRLAIADVELVQVSLQALLTSMSGGFAGLSPELGSPSRSGAMAEHLGLRRIDADPETVEQGLVTLVLTVVELLRQLMGRQALRRVADGDLSEDQVEQVGATLLALDQRMAELRDHFGLTPADLNIDLGPLGPLLPPG
jgi:Gas vesicle protein K/Gas vesicle protein